MSGLISGLKKPVVFFHKIYIFIPHRGIKYYEGKPDKSPKSFKKFVLTWFVAIPFVILATLNLPLQKGGLPKQRRPEFRPYEHLRLRNKRFPWGDGQKSLFHNSYWNALPDGYEPNSDIYDENQDHPCDKEKEKEDKASTKSTGKTS